jgi:NAD(P)-dependent dehydrogenase (short-subunit alcohol dehydrogenase family)
MGFMVSDKSRLLDGKVALIAGTATAIGQATVIAFAEAGAKVVIGDRAIAPWQLTLNCLRDRGAEVLFQPTDVTLARAVQKLVQQTVTTFGSLDVAFNNTCINTAAASLAAQDEEEVARVIDTNLNGLWLCLKSEIEQMLTGNGGAIVNNSSLFGLVGCSQGGIYVGTKHAVVGITRAAALDYAHQGIRVNAVAPSSTDPKVVAATPLGRAIQPQEVANAVVWLCCDLASFITGHTLPVDGGFSAQ